MRRASGLLAMGVASIACAAACTADRHAPESVRTSAAQGSTSTPLAPRQSSVIDAPWTQAKPPANCPVTVGSPATVPPSVLEANDMPVPWAVHWFGDGTLWTRLPPTGVLPVEPGEAGQLSWTTKFPWWRTTPGQLTIRARLLGADAAGDFTALVPAGYAAIGFQPSGLNWSALGCWQVTAEHAGDSLTFTVWLQPLPHA